MRGFTERHIPGLFYRVDNDGCYAGHVKLLGCCVHMWGNEVGGRDTRECA